MVLRNTWATTFAWGKNNNSPGHNLNGFLLESTLRLSDIHTFFSRFEDVEKDELFEETDTNSGRVFRVKKIALGYIYDFPEVLPHLTIGLGGEGSWAILPNSLDSTYDDTPFSFLLFIRGKIV